MAGGAASETIMFIGSIIAATAVVGALGFVVQDLSGGLRTRGSAMSKELGTDITIINDPLAMTTSPLTLYVKNTGDTRLTPSLTDVFLDGVPSTNTTFDILGAADDETWRPGDVLKIVVGDLAVGVGDHRVRVHAETGIEALLEFYQS